MHGSPVNPDRQAASQATDRTATAADGPSVPAPSPTDETAVVHDPLLGRVATADGLFVTDENQRIANWSSSAQRMLGFSAEEVVGRPCWLVLMGREPDGHPVCRRSCPVTKNARRGRGTASYEVSARTRGGGSKLVWNSVVVLESDRGFRVMHLLRDAPASPHASRARPERSEGPAAGTASASAGSAAAAAESPRRHAADLPPIETLTRRELEALRLFAQEATIDDLARELGISVFTARNHIASAQRKLGARNRLEMVLLAMRRGLI